MLETEIDLERGRAIQDLLSTPTYYDTASSIKKVRGSKSIAQVLAGDVEEAVVVAPVSRLDKLVRKIGMVGLLVMPQVKGIRVAGKLVYHVTCTCGESDYLTAEEVLHRRYLGVGCMRHGCTESTLESAIWTNPVTAVRLQLAQAEALFPDKLAQEWKDLGPVRGADRLLELCATDIGLARRSWWFEFEKAGFLTSTGMMTFGVWPDTYLFPGHVMSVDLATLMRNEGEISD